MEDVIKSLGGPAEVARICGVKSPSVIEWRQRGIPPERCPALERASDGRYPVERLRPDIRWHRVTDPDWPWHPAGRPLIDVAKGVAPDARQAA